MASAAAPASARAPVVAYVNQSTFQLQLYDAQTGAAVPAPAITVKHPIQNGLAMSFSGRYIVYVAASDGLIHLFDRVKNAEIPLPGINVYGSPSNLTVSDTGLIAFDNTGNGPVQLYNSASGAFISTGLPSGHRQPVLSGDGKFLATTCITGATAHCVNDNINSGNSTLFVQNLTTQSDTGVPVLHNNNEDEEHPCIDADGGLAGADVGDTPHRNVYVFNRSTSSDLSLGFANTPSTADTIRCYLSFGGAYIDVQDNGGVPRLYDVATGSQIPLPAAVMGTPIDLTAPFVPPNAPTITVPANGGNLGQGEVVDAHYSCSDPAGGMGIASCAGPVANGGAISTAALGKHTFTVTATDVNGLTATSTSTYTVLAPPKLKRPRQRHRVWGEHKSPGNKPPFGTVFSFKLNEAATVLFEFKQHGHGHKRKSFTKNGHPGLNKVRFRGAIPHSHKLPPGTYTVEIIATNAAGQKSRPVFLKFKILK